MNCTDTQTHTHRDWSYLPQQGKSSFRFWSLDFYESNLDILKETICHGGAQWQLRGIVGPLVRQGVWLAVFSINFFKLQGIALYWWRGAFFTLLLFVLSWWFLSVLHCEFLYLKFNTEEFVFNTKTSRGDFSESLQFLQVSMGKMLPSGAKMDLHTCMNYMRYSKKLFYTFCTCSLKTYWSKCVSSSIKECWDTAGNST